VPCVGGSERVHRQLCPAAERQRVQRAGLGHLPLESGGLRRRCNTIIEGQPGAGQRLHLLRVHARWVFMFAFPVCWPLPTFWKVPNEIRVRLGRRVAGSAAAAVAVVPCASLDRHAAQGAFSRISSVPSILQRRISLAPTSFAFMCVGGGANYGTGARYNLGLTLVHEVSGSRCCQNRSCPLRRHDCCRIEQRRPRSISAAPALCSEFSAEGPRASQAALPKQICGPLTCSLCARRPATGSACCTRSKAGERCSIP